MKKVGVYIHVPFCIGKCPYCDFYSLNKAGGEIKSKYVSSLMREMKEKKDIVADTVYLGGGTPSALSKEELKIIIETAKEVFNFTAGEITVECNPSSVDEEKIELLASCGVNRISLGLQSFNENERKLLGRKSSPERTEEIIKDLNRCGINNISLDVMLGIPDQTIPSLRKTLDFCIKSGVKHISAYILKIEENTFYGKHPERYNFPDEDAVAKMYEFTCEYLNGNGFLQYEVSNFAKAGYESRHNMKYWKCEEYLGFGPAAHSFFRGERFYHLPELENYIENPLSVVPDGKGGYFSEYAMLRLRLTEGLKNDETIKIYGHGLPEKMIEKAKKFQKYGFTEYENGNIRLTEKGFLISNYLISELL